MAHAEAIESWLSENQHQMVSCPHQPGELRISRYACVKRYETAKKQEGTQNSGRARMRSLFEEVVNNGLSRCLSCQIGEELSGSE